MKSCLDSEHGHDAEEQGLMSTIDVETDVMKCLRSSTRAEHQALEDVDFNCRLAQGEISGIEYAALLEVHRIVHEALEHVLGSHSHAKVQAVWQNYQAKVELIDTDQRLFPLESSEFDDALALAEAFADAIRTCAADSPDWLLGVLYVVEGSTLGGMFLRPRIAEGLGCDPDQIHYYGAYGRDTKKRWVEFTDRMNRAFVEPAAIARCVQGGKDAFESYRRIFERLSTHQAIEAAS
jgi:heme oxygenase